MSDRPFLKPAQVITNASMASSVTSLVIILNQKTGCGYDLSWTGTPTGTFSVEVSNTFTTDGFGNVSNAGNWTAVTLSGPISASGSADNAFINLAGLEAYAIRLVYTRVSGSGTLNAYICGKVQ
jgi:hypothetical protein